ncbi:DUF1624 domain-containing protein [Chryseolinea lacunae]|uniref:DUF1624 domain-containing protein n=1 Tax=Chryseolinea lacunae TaxID=2801331 RepID=A0ABS1KQ25_9BACT|nr:heparan-alpha-glucosaminide N-acetyltransferase domain-containing protein [Chryseolinea lacunae]MBL0741570.1 DUF1624 domain-containing protein [Chryseolinea lacunae]
MLKSTTTRIESIDLLRGLVMVLMALDHVRDYFHADAFLYNPVDLTQTSVALFFTRWFTHFCAPVFVFLAGTSAFIVGTRKGKQELTAFLLKRGLWLVFLELTIVNFAWFFNFQFPLPSLFVIWALGMGMVILSVCIHLPFRAILVLGLMLVAGHNLLDGIHVEGNGAGAILWSVLHEFHLFPLSPDRNLFIGYPLLPWTGIMLLGYCFGTFYTSSFDAASRKKILTYLGASSIALFIVIRFFNGYGDPNHWSVQSSPVFTVLSFINVTKYPPSLLYVLVTLGPALLLLAAAEQFRSRVAQALVTLGRVPMFYYLLHIYLIHGLAVIAALLTGYSFSDMIFSTWVTDSPGLKGYGFSLPVVYAVWFGVVALLYPLCRWYEKYKGQHREQWWLSYL